MWSKSWVYWLLFIVLVICVAMYAHNKGMIDTSMVTGHGEDDLLEAYAEE